MLVKKKSTGLKFYISKEAFESLKERGTKYEIIDNTDELADIKGIKLPDVIRKAMIIEKPLSMLTKKELQEKCKGNPSNEWNRLTKNELIKYLKTK